MMLRRIAVVVTLVAGSYAIAESQELAIHYYAEKSTNYVGEPIFVSAELMNISSQSVRFNDGACSQSFIPVFPPSPRKITKLYGCSGGGFGGDCLSAPIELKPGEKLLQRFLLPDGLEPDRAGDFDYRVERGVIFDARDGSHKVQKVSGTFTVHEVESDGARLRADYASLVAELESPDPQQRWLAATAITQHPQGFLESVILRLSWRPETMGVSITGLQKLGSDEAKRRLAELTDSRYEESTRQSATTALAELGDKSYCDVMLQVMSLRQGYSSDIAARGAGLLCGERAIPQLVALSSSPNMFPAYEVAYALGNTGSRNAVPALIELLHTVDGEQLRAVQEALYTLTHRRSSSGKSGADEYQEWTNWWAFEGKTAQIFDPSECP